MKIKISVLVVIFVLKLFTMNFCFADEFSISIATTDQKYPSSASCEDNFFVAWEDSRRGTTNLNIYGQLVLGSGSSPTAGYAITTELGNQTSPAVGANATDYLIVWVDQDIGAYPQLFGRLFNNADRDFTGAAFQITTSASSKSKPVVASDGTNFLVIWQDYVTDGDYSIKGIRVSDRGSPMGSIIEITSGGGKFGVPSICWGESQYLIAFRDSSDYIGISGKFFTDDVSAIGTKFPVVTGSSNMNFPAVTWDGVTFFVTWQDYDYTTYTDIYGIKVSPSGEVFPEVLAIAVVDQNQANPAVAWGSTAYLISWQDDRAGVYTDIFGRWVSWSGALLDIEMMICSASAGQQDVTISWNGDKFFLAWGDYRNGWDSDIWAYLIDPHYEVPEGPLAYSFYPLEGSISALSEQCIKMKLTDYEGVDETSVVLEVAGVEYTSADVELMVFSDSLVWCPEIPFTEDDTINFELAEALDTEGNPLTETYTSYFVMDLSPPRIVSMLPGPGDTIDTDIDNIVFNLWDLSGLDEWQLRLDLNEWILYIGYEYLFLLDTLVILDIDRSEITLTEGETLNFCLHISDLPDLGEANVLDTCWVSYVRTSAIDDLPNKVDNFQLLPNYPNPFNDNTTFRFQLTEGSIVNLDLYNTKGQKLESIVDNFLPTGYHQIQHDLEDYPSGIYFIILKANRQEIRQKILLMK